MLWSLNCIQRSKDGKWTLVRTINPITNSNSKDGAFSEELCGELTADCIRNAQSLGREKIKRIVQYAKQRYGIEGSHGTSGDHTGVSATCTLKFDFSQLVDTSV